MTSAAAQQSFEEGLAAYRQGQFELAAHAFSAGLKQDPSHWEMHLYLGMAYVRMERIADARRQFLEVRDLCPDADMRKKAQTALGAISPTTSQQGIKKVSSG